MKLENCECQGDEYIMDQFRCSDVRRNMENLCLDPPEEETTPKEEEEVDEEISSNEIDVDEEETPGKKKSAGNSNLNSKSKYVILQAVIVAIASLFIFSLI